MIATKLWNYIKGYVIILVEGRYIEKFINICARRKILLWDLKRRGQLETEMKTGIKGFKRIRPAARRSGSKVRILKKHGFPFLLHRYRRRKAFALGILVFACILNIMAMFIWDISVEGADRVKAEEITEILDSMGIRPGTVKYGIDPEDISGTVMLKMAELAWCGAELRGTRLKLRIKDRRMPPEIVPVDEPCNIVARVDGLIESIDVKNGREMVKPGDTVKKGQILVSGIVESSRDSKDVLFVHAVALIKARTWYEGVAEAGLLVNERKTTGREKTVYYLDIFGRKIRIPFTNADFQQFEMTEECKRLTIGKNFVLPFGIAIEKYVEYREVPREIDDEECKIIAGDNAYEKALAEIPETARIVRTELYFDKTEEGKRKARVIIECVEDMGIEQKIGG